jgi:hypothetical protein
MMKWLLGSLIAVVASGCVFQKEIPKHGNDPYLGGTLTLDQCMYSVSTVAGASMPQPARVMLGSDPTPKLVHVNVANDPRTGVAILWRTNDESTLSTTVQYGVNGKTDQTQLGFTFDYDAAPLGTIKIHETHLCGLTPDTEYSYRVGGQDGTRMAWSPVYTFRTLPDFQKSPDATVHMLVIGDTRDGYSAWGQALKIAYQKGTPDIILFSGDETSLGPVQVEWDTWFTAADPLLASTPMIVAHGNHEANSVNFFSQFAMPGDEQNFGVDFGPVHLTVANDTPVNPADLTGRNATLLGKNLAAGNSAPWNILMHHKPMFSASAGPHVSDVLLMRNAWESIIDANRVDIVFNGHDHDYERSRPMRKAMVQSDPSQGTVFVVVGAAGADLYDNGHDYWTAFSEKTYSFALVDVSKSMLSLTAYDGAGAMLDSYMIAK